MANEEHLKILMQGVEVWNAWQTTHRSNRQPSPDLRTADLRKASLNGVRLFGAQLDSACLDGASLNHADLVDASLNHASLGGASLRGADLIDASLFRADLKGACLDNALLQDAGLNHARLDDASLRRATLIGTSLNDASLVKARLDNADLHGAYLDGAGLNGASLHGTSLFNTSLQSASFAEATFSWTTLNGVDLSQVDGLESVVHRSPSGIATSTLERTATGLAKDPSRQEEIESFFRGAGVEDYWLDYFRSRIGQPIEFYSCFISYSHADKSFARRLYADLQARGIRCWLDEKDLRPGDVMIDAITDAIRLRDKVLVCCSLASLTSGWVDQELTAALEIERRERKKIIIPLDLDGYLFDGWEGGKAPLVRERVAADFKGWQLDNAKYEEQFERVVKALRTGDVGH